MKTPHNELRELRLSKGIPGKDMIEIVREYYPKYDKIIQSKCEHGEDYGIQLRKDAMDALVDHFAPEMAKRKGHDGHKRLCRIQCRLSDEAYVELQQRIQDDGFSDTQSWLEHLVITYLAYSKSMDQVGDLIRKEHPHD